MARPGFRASLLAPMALAAVAILGCGEDESSTRAAASEPPTPKVAFEQTKKCLEKADYRVLGGPSSQGDRDAPAYEVIFGSRDRQASGFIALYGSRREARRLESKINERGIAAVFDLQTAAILWVKRQPSDRVGRQVSLCVTQPAGHPG